jgi:hypothetical protein
MPTILQTVKARYRRAAGHVDRILKSGTPAETRASANEIRPGDEDCKSSGDDDTHAVGPSQWSDRVTVLVATHESGRCTNSPYPEVRRSVRKGGTFPVVVRRSAGELLTHSRRRAELSCRPNLVSS